MGLNPAMMCLWTHTTAIAKIRFKPSAYICRNIAFLSLEPKSLSVSRGSSQPTVLGLSRWKPRHRRHLRQHCPLWGSLSQASPHAVPQCRGTDGLGFQLRQQLLPNSRLHCLFVALPRSVTKIHLPIASMPYFLGRGWCLARKLNFCLTLHAF